MIHVIKNSLDCIVLTEVLNYNTENCSVIKTNNSLFNRNSWIIIIFCVNDKYQIIDFV